MVFDVIEIFLDVNWYLCILVVVDENVWIYWEFFFCVCFCVEGGFFIEGELR